MNKEDLKNVVPLGRTFACLTKKYLGILADKLEFSGIDRFFYPLVLIHKESGNLTQQKLSDILATDKVTTVRVIDYLSKKGLVKRQVNKNDRREHLLSTTSKAEKIIPRIKKAFEELEENAFKGMNKSRIEDFNHCLQLVQRNLSGLPSKKINHIKFNKTKRLTK
jgi:DNA-binding MarR family transcriptional regulator